TPTTVQAGMASNTMSLAFEVAPPLADATVIVCRAYDPPTTSVPAADADPFAVTRATCRSPSGAVAALPNSQLRTWLDAVSVRLATRPPPMLGAPRGAQRGWGSRRRDGVAPAAGQRGGDRPAPRSGGAGSGG